MSGEPFSCSCLIRIHNQAGECPTQRSPFGLGGGADGFEHAVQSSWNNDSTANRVMRRTKRTATTQINGSRLRTWRIQVLPNGLNQE